MLTLFAAAITLMGGPDTPMPGTPVNGPSAVSWPFGSGLIDTGIKTTSDAYIDGHFSITAPVFSDIGRDGTLGGNVVFVEPYISWGEQGEVATSLGLGYRHLFNKQPLTALQQPSVGLLAEGLMLGGNVFLDMLDTQTDNRFWQLGFGLEVATRYLELRANYYQPLTGRQEGEPILQREVQRGTFLTSGKEPFATGHTIQQDVTFTTYDFYTDYLFRTYEEGLEGWDADAALLVPGLDRWCELWLIGGYGSFENKPFGPQLAGTGEVAGWKAGVEFRPVPQMVLSATWFEDERLSGGEWLYGLSLQLPLDPEPSNTRKNWWRKLKDTMRPRSRHLAERSAVPVHRQNAAIKVGNSISEPEVTQYSKVVSEVEKRVVVRDDVIFVNNGGAQGNGIAAHGAVEDGTAERPFDTVPEGVILAATVGYQAGGVPTVYVAGGGPDYGGEQWFFNGNTELILKSGVQLASGGYGVPAFAGQSFGLGVPARIQAGAESLAIGGNSGANQSRFISVDGFDFLGRVFVTAEQVAVRSNAANQGLIVEGFDAEVTGNTVFGDFQVRDSLFAARERLDGPTTANVSGNTIVGSGTSDVSLIGYTYATFVDNDFYWSIPGFGGAPGEPMAAVNFWSCSEVSLGNNRITIDGYRSDIPGVAVFGFIGPTVIHNLGGNEAIRGRDPRQRAYGIYQAANLAGPATALFGSLSVNGVPINLSSGSSLLQLLW